MPLRDGLDRRPLTRCREWCRLVRCSAICAKSAEDRSLRSLGWHPIEDAPLAPGLELEGLTTNGRRVLIRYLSTGDYADRWISAVHDGPLLDLTHWRPLRSNLPAPLR